MTTLPTSFDGMIESKYMKKDDVETPRTLTVAAFTRENVAQKGEPDEHKWIMHFREQDMKPMVLNPTNVQLLKLALGVNSPAESVGKRVTVFNDPTVSFGGKLTGGVRIRSAMPASGDFDDFEDTATKEKELSEAAREGIQALQAAWSGLSVGTKYALRPKLPALKEIATKADATPKNVDTLDDDIPF